MFRDRLISNKTKLLTAVFLVSVLSVFFSGCSNKLVDQGEKQMGAIIESIQANFAEEGWTYTGYEVMDKDEENDTAVVLISYDVEGNPAELLKNHTSEQPVSDSVYGLAEDINVKREVELSAYDKANDAMGCAVKSTTWYVGDTEANEWIQEQNKQ